MRVTIVCTGNVARSPALAVMLSRLRPDLTVESRAVGLRAVDGRRMNKQMRLLMADAGMAEPAEEHRSRVYRPEDPKPDIVVCCAAVHVDRMRNLDPTATLWACTPPVPDPAFGGAEAYERVFPMIFDHARKLADMLEVP